MSTLTLLRHGQASFGAAHYDELSAQGIEQARACGLWFAQRGLVFDRVHSGPRQRQFNTAQLAIAALPAVSVQTDAGLDEFGEGAQILRAAEARTGLGAFSDTQMPHQQRLRLYAEEIRLWTAGEVMIEGVVAASVFRAQVRAWLDALTGETGQSRQVLAVSSAGVIAAIVCELLELPDREMSRVMSVIDNASLTTVLWSRHGRTLKSFNQTAHLPPALLSGI